MKIQGVNFNMDALKGYSKEKFIKQYRHMFKNIDVVCKELGITDSKKPKKKKLKELVDEEIEAQKLAEKLKEDKVNKPQFD